MNFDNLSSAAIWLFVLFLIFGRNAAWILIIGGAGIAVLLWGTPAVWIGGFFAVAGVVGVASSRMLLEVNSRVVGKTQTAHGKTYCIEQGHMIRNRDTNYPMTVPESIARKAMATGSYFYEGAAIDDGGHYTTDDTYIPGGFIRVDNDTKYRDERLNS